MKALLRVQPGTAHTAGSPHHYLLPRFEFPFYFYLFFLCSHFSEGSLPCAVFPLSTPPEGHVLELVLNIPSCISLKLSLLDPQGQRRAENQMNFSNSTAHLAKSQSHTWIKKEKKATFLAQF